MIEVFESCIVARPFALLLVFPSPLLQKYVLVQVKEYVAMEQRTFLPEQVLLQDIAPVHDRNG